VWQADYRVEKLLEELTTLGKKWEIHWEEGRKEGEK